MTLHGVLAQLTARRADYARLRVQVDGAALLDEILALLSGVNGDDGASRDLTTREAAPLLGIRSHRTVERYCRAGRFPHAYKTSTTSGDWRIPAADLSAYRAQVRG